MELKPFIEMSVVQRIIPHSNVKQFKYLHVLMQEFHIKVDLIFINELFEIVSSESTEEEAVRSSLTSLVKNKILIQFSLFKIHTERTLYQRSGRTTPATPRTRHSPIATRTEKLLR